MPTTVCPNCGQCTGNAMDEIAQLRSVADSLEAAIESGVIADLPALICTLRHIAAGLGATLTRDYELAAITVAYDALRPLGRHQWDRALNYLASRLAADARGLAISLKTRELPPPVQWVRAGELDTACASENEVVETYGDTLQIIEVNAITVVSQKFAVVIPDDEPEIMWFTTQSDAEKYLRDVFRVLHPAAPAQRE